MGEGIVMRSNQRSWGPGRALPAWLLVFACVLAGAPVGAVQARELRGWSVHADDYPVNQGMQQFAQAMGRISAGKHTARVYGNAQLAPQGKVLEEMGSGAIDFAEIGVAGYGDRVPALQVLGMPYLFHDSEQMFALLDGELGRLLSSELRKYDVILLGWYDGGTRNFYHRSKPLRRVSDFHGEKLRVAASRGYTQMVEALGGKPVTLPFKDVLGAFEKGQVDGAENNLPSYESTGHYKLAPHYTLTRHLVSPEMLLMSRRTWEQFDPAAQRELLEAGRLSALHMREQWNRRLLEIQARLEKQGVKFHAGGDAGPMVRRMRPLYEPLWASSDPLSRQALGLVLKSMAGR